MGQPARNTVQISDFPGLITNVDHHDLPDGAADIQTNVVCQSVGQIVTRKGYREVSFESS
jgi:hypothetical protein